MKVQILFSNSDRRPVCEPPPRVITRQYSDPSLRYSRRTPFHDRRSVEYFDDLPEAYSGHVHDFDFPDTRIERRPQSLSRRPSWGFRHLRLSDEDADRIRRRNHRMSESEEFEDRRGTFMSDRPRRSRMTEDEIEYEDRQAHRHRRRRRARDIDDLLDDGEYSPPGEPVFELFLQVFYAR